MIQKVYRGQKQEQKSDRRIGEWLFGHGTNEKENDCTDNIRWKCCKLQPLIIATRF